MRFLISISVIILFSILMALFMSSCETPKLSVPIGKTGTSIWAYGVIGISKASSETISQK